MKVYYYVGLDIHKKTISYCVKEMDGAIVMEGGLPSRRKDIQAWVKTLPEPWIAGMEATMFTGWVYDYLRSFSGEVCVGHPYRMRAIASCKRKNDQLDARTLADLLRCDLFPKCYMAPENLRELRRVLRYRNLLVQESTRMKNRTACLLMEVGTEYNKKRLHGKRYFHNLLGSIEDVPESVLHLLRLSRESMELFEQNQRWLVQELKIHPEIRERVDRLMTIDGVGEITALTWVLEVGDPHRFPSINKAVSYCGLCSAENSSAGVAKRGPLSKQRNKHLQCVLVEAAKLAPRWNPSLRALYGRERERGANWNKATLSVARKLVAYMLCVEKTGNDFKYRDAA